MVWITIPAHMGYLYHCPLCSRRTLQVAITICVCVCLKIQICVFVILFSFILGIISYYYWQQWGMIHKKSELKKDNKLASENQICSSRASLVYKAFSFDLDDTPLRYIRNKMLWSVLYFKRGKWRLEKFGHILQRCDGT